MRKLLVVVDMQNDFIDGALGTKEAEAIVDNVAKKIQEYKQENIFYTMDTHQEDYLSTQEGRFLPVEHCVEMTDGWRIHPKLEPLLSMANCVKKLAFGSFRLCDLIEDIYEEENGEIEIEVVGLCTDICVVCNALMLKVRFHEVPIKVDSSCCAGVTPEKHEAALETMKSCQIIIE
ncbi:MAG: cysteine hydrolase [Firmicutes bacterium]|nr:cysteine hydrolase [Bacillota bacterium]